MRGKRIVVGLAVVVWTWLWVVHQAVGRPDRVMEPPAAIHHIEEPQGTLVEYRMLLDVPAGLSPDEYAYINYYAAAIAQGVGWDSTGVDTTDGLAAAKVADFGVLWTRRRWEWPQSDWLPPEE